jgi:hypothetical protein
MKSFTLVTQPQLPRGSPSPGPRPRPRARRRRRWRRAAGKPVTVIEHRDHSRTIPPVHQAHTQATSQNSSTNEETPLLSACDSLLDQALWFNPQLLSIVNFLHIGL